MCHLASTKPGWQTAASGPRGICLAHQPYCVLQQGRHHIPAAPFWRLGLCPELNGPASGVAHTSRQRRGKHSCRFLLKRTKVPALPGGFCCSWALQQQGLLPPFSRLGQGLFTCTHNHRFADLSISTLFCPANLPCCGALSFRRRPAAVLALCQALPAALPHTGGPQQVCTPH